MANKEWFEEDADLFLEKYPVQDERKARVALIAMLRTARMLGLYEATTKLQRVQAELIGATHEAAALFMQYAHAATGRDE